MTVATINVRKNHLAFVLLAAGANLMFSLSIQSVAQAPTPPPSYNPTNPRPVVPQALPSVSVGADHRVTFRIHSPEARTVTINGDFLLGAPAAAMTRGDNGTWTYTSLPLTPDSYTYTFTVDGVMVLDTSNQNFKDTLNSLFDFFDMPDSSTGFMHQADGDRGRCCSAKCGRTPV